MKFADVKHITLFFNILFPLFLANRNLAFWKIYVLLIQQTLTLVTKKVVLNNWQRLGSKLEKYLKTEGKYLSCTYQACSARFK